MHTLNAIMIITTCTASQSVSSMFLVWSHVYDAFWDRFQNKVLDVAYLSDLWFISYYCTRYVKYPGPFDLTALPNVLHESDHLQLLVCLLGSSFWITTTHNHRPHIGFPSNEGFMSCLWPTTVLHHEVLNLLVPCVYMIPVIIAVISVFLNSYCLVLRCRYNYCYIMSPPLCYYHHYHNQHLYTGFLFHCYLHKCMLMYDR